MISKTNWIYRTTSAGRSSYKKPEETLKVCVPFIPKRHPPSLFSPIMDRWHCFGCGKGGDIFNFAMEVEGVDFHTALEDLAAQAGVILKPLSPAQKQQETEAERLRSVIQEARYYYNTFKDMRRRQVMRVHI